MPWRLLVVSTPAFINIRNAQLVLAKREEKDRENNKISFPVVDLAVLVLESHDCIITSAALAACAQHNVLVLVCNEQHIPFAAMLPTAGNSRIAKIQRMQLASGIVIKKRIWQMVVCQKIKNQARCLELSGKPGASELLALIPSVKSGDTTNREALAARIYFSRLFGDKFHRVDTTQINSALNYGYAIMRGTIARYLAAYGLLLTHGVHHHSELNPFNLADDFIEPLRPLVDLLSVQMMTSQSTEFNKSNRSALLALLTCEMKISAKTQGLLRCCEIMASSLQSALLKKDANLLILPELLPIKAHEYE